MADAIVENLFLVNAPAGSGKTTWIKYIYSLSAKNCKENMS